MGVLGAATLNRGTGGGDVAQWLNEDATVLVIIGAIVGLSLLRYLTVPLRLRRARAACYTSGVVVAAPDLLGLVTGGEVVEGVSWVLIETYRDSTEHVALYKHGSRLAAIRVPVHDETQRIAFLKLLDERGVTRAE